MAAGSYGGILPARNTDLDVGDNLQECHRGLPEVYADSWLDLMDHRNRDIHLARAASQGPYQYGVEVKKDWLFEVILVALTLPFFLVLGRSPFGGSRKIREGTPFPSLTHLAHIRLFFHQLS
jgi:hypothetical protein